jgi:hypothetical protein
LTTDGSESAIAQMNWNDEVGALLIRRANERETGVVRLVEKLESEMLDVHHRREVSE